MKKMILLAIAIFVVSLILFPAIALAAPCEGIKWYSGVGQYDIIRVALILTAEICCLGMPRSFLYHSQHAPENTKRYLINTIWLILFMSVVGGVVLVLLVFFKRDYFGFFSWFALLAIGFYIPIYLMSFFISFAT